MSWTTKSIPAWRSTDCPSGQWTRACAVGLLLVQSRIFEGIANSRVLTGAIDDLARQFGVPPHDFLHCLDGLVHAGWITIWTDREALLSIQLEP
jgi:hypothetical protein